MSQSGQAVTLFSQGLPQSRRYHSSSFAILTLLFVPLQRSFPLLVSLFSLLN